MHSTSLENMQKCYKGYIQRYDWPGREIIKVIDIGGANIFGSYANIFSSHNFDFKAVDLSPNEGVDIVLDNPYELPFPDESIDIVISGQCFEHVEFFWLLFTEISRVVKPDGFVILIVPSAGPIHRYPVDCYRFYPDAFVALAKYTGIKVVDIWLDERGPWKDLVGIFSKNNILSKYDYSNEIPKDKFNRLNRLMIRLKGLLRKILHI